MRGCNGGGSRGGRTRSDTTVLVRWGFCGCSVGGGCGGGGDGDGEGWV